MIHPRNLLLGVVVAVLVALNFALERPRLEVMADSALLPRLVRDDVARVEVERAASTDAPAALVVIARTDAGWSVEQLGGFPAQSWLVESLIDRLSALRTTAQVAREESSWEELGVSEQGSLRLRFLDTSGLPLASIVLGHPVQSAASAERSPHVRLEGRSEVYRAPGVPWVEPDPVHWIQTALFELGADEVSSLRLTVPDPSWRRQRFVAFTRSDAGAWLTSSGERAPRSAMRRLLDQLCELQVAELESTRPAALLEAVGLMRLGLEDAAGASAELVIGPLLPDGTRLAALQAWLDADQPWRIRLDPQIAAELTGRARDLATLGQ